MTKKIEIRKIKDYQGNIYDIYDIMIIDKFGQWRSICTYTQEEITLKELCKTLKDYPIIDKRRKNEKDIF